MIFILISLQIHNTHEREGMPMFVHDMKDLVDEPKLRDYNYPLSMECDVHVRGYVGRFIACVDCEAVMYFLNYLVNDMFCLV